MEYSCRILRDIDMDAWNWYAGCNEVGYGVDWKQRVDPEVAEKVHGKTIEESRDFIYQYLQKYYVDNASEMSKGEDFIRSRFDEDFHNACHKLIEITGKPLYRNGFTVYLTTFPRGPYNYEKGEFWLHVYWVNPIANFMHETLHFQFIKYWRENPDSPVSRLADDAFENFKEALTVVLDESVMPLIERADKGYEMHRELRDKLHAFWLKNKNFDELVEYGLALLI